MLVVNAVPCFSVVGAQGNVTVEVDVPSECIKESEAAQLHPRVKGGR